MANTSSKKTIEKVAASAIMIALSTVLSMVKVWQMPLGGSITLLSMLPVCMISIIYGTVWAIGPCVLYGAIQMFIDGVFGWGLTAGILVGSIFFDYLIAFGVLCIAGIFRKKGYVGIILGVSLACVCRFISHFISGCVFFRSFDVFNNPYVYSLAYNGTYMLPELIITTVAAVALFKIPAVSKLVKANI